MNRFLIIELDNYEHPTMRTASESQVSNRIDTDDFGEGRFKVLYLNDAGELVPITTGKMRRCSNDDEQSIIYGYSDIIADGKVVGSVAHTDH